MSGTTDSLTGASVSTTKGQAVTNAANKKSTSTDLDKDAFLKLLLAELQYQDPLSPMDNTEFIAQMAQFSALEQMQNLNSTMTASQAYNLIGKDVYASHYNTSTNKYEDVTGTVEYVTVKSGVPYVSIDGTEVKYSEVQYVYSNSTSGTDSDNSANQAISLIGKTVQALTLDDSLENVTGFVEGKVDYIKFINGSPVLSVGGKDVYLYEVMSVSESSLLIGSNVSAYVGEDSVVSGTIDDISIDGDNLYAKISGNKILIKDLSSLMNALAYVGKNVTAGEVSGTVDSVIIKKSVPYLVVNGTEVSVDDVE